MTSVMLALIKAFRAALT